MASPIDLDKMKNAGVTQEVIDVYKRVKKDLLEDEDRKVWKENRKKNWSAAYPLDTEKDGVWTEKEKQAMIAKGMIPIAKNYLARDIQGSSALITSKSPGLLFLPIGTSDLYVAELFKRGWDFIINGNDGPVTFYDFIKEKNIGNLSCMEVHHDPSAGIFGKILIEEFDPTTYYFDKDSRKRDHSDVSFGKARLVTKEYALETYEELTEADLMFSPLPKEDEDDESVPDGKTGEDNYAVETGDKPGPDEDARETPNVWEIEDWEFKKERELWLMQRDDTQAYGWKRHTYKNHAEAEKDGWVLSGDKQTAMKTIMNPDAPPQKIEALVWKRLVAKRIQRIIVGKKMISKTVNPLGIDAEGMPVLSIITLIADKTLSGYPTGPTSRALESNRAHNKRDIQAIYIASKNADPTWVLPQGCKWVKDEVHGDYIEVSKDAGLAPRELGPVNSSNEMINLAQKDEQDIHDEYGINDIVQGKIPVGQSNMAHRTVLALQEMVGVISSPNVLTFEGALVKVGKAAAALMLMVWPRQMWERLIEPDEMGSWQPDKDKQVNQQTGKPAEPQPDMIKQKWMDALDKLTGENGQIKTDLIDIDVKLVAGSTQPTNRMAKKGEALELVKAGVYDTEAFLDYTDDPKKDQIAERMERKRQEELDAIRQGQEVKKTKVKQ